MLKPSFLCPTCLAAVLATASAVALARPEPQATGAPAFVDFRAVAEDGQPVADLKPADVTLRVGGRVRPVKSLELVRLGGDNAAMPIASKLPAPFATNAVSTRPGTRRELLIVVDELSISPGKEPPIRQALGRLLSALTPSDRVGLLSTRQGGVSLGFTEAREEVAGALTRFSGYAPAQLSDTDFSCNATLVLNTLKNAYAQFSPVSAPTLVFVSAGVAGPKADKMAAIGKESELCPLRTNHFEEAGVAAVASRANTYVVHALEASSTSQSPQAGQIGVDAIAGSTGAETIRMTGGTTDTSLVRIAQETSAYYLAEFEPDASDRSGNRQRVEVRVARDRVRVNARPNIVIAKGEAAGGAKPATPGDMIRVATMFTDLPLRAAWHARRNQDGKIRIDALFEPLDPTAKIGAVTVIMYDEKGKSRAQWKPQGSDLARSPILASLAVEPGTYRMRVAATDAAGRAGTVDSEVRANLTQAGGVSISHLVLGVPAGGFTPRLDFTANDQQAIGLVEIYGVPKGAAVAVTFELAETDKGPSIATGPAQIAAGPTEDTRLAFGGFGIAPMQPGDLLVRAVVTVDGKPIGTVSRTLRKTK